MKINNISLLLSVLATATASITTTPSLNAETTADAFAANSGNIVDQFSDPAMTSLGHLRIIIDDASLGGKSKFETKTGNGQLEVSGQIKPARGQPGFVSMVLMLNGDGSPRDISEFKGVSLKIKVTKGNVSALVASADITNFDYHSFAIPRKSGGVAEVKIPFEKFKRLWSEQIPLNLKTIASVNLVASGLQPGKFSYTIDEVSFYK